MSASECKRNLTVKGMWPSQEWDMSPDVMTLKDLDLDRLKHSLTVNQKLFCISIRLTATFVKEMYQTVE